jgi:hypothetical protein
MTPDEFIAKTGTQIVLRSFADDPDRSVAVEDKWSAAVSPHYYTTDTCRLVMGDRDRDPTGWGATPDEAVESLARKMRTQLHGRCATWQVELAVAQAERDKFEALFTQAAPEAEAPQDVTLAQ